MSTFFSDPRMDLPELLEGRKPTEAVEIDWDHPMSEGLIQDFEFNANRDLVNGDKLTFYGGAKISNGKFISTNIGDAASTKNRFINNCSVALSFSIRNTADWAYLFDTYGGTNLRDLCVYSNSDSIELYTSNLNRGSFSAGAFRNFKSHSMVINDFGGANLCYIDGNFVNDWSNGGLGLADTLYLGSRYTKTEPLNGFIEYFRVYDKILSVAGIKQLRETPYQYLIPADS